MEGYNSGLFKIIYALGQRVLNEAREQAEPLAEALLAGGLPVMEITFRTAAAEESIRRIAHRFPDMLVGAGTLLTIDDTLRWLHSEYLPDPFVPEALQRARGGES